MPLPTRPTAGASIATAWGQDVHDRVFAPKGCKVAGAAFAAFANDGSYRTMALDSATDDPGGWLDAANDQLIVPTGAEGLYLITFYATSVSGTANTQRDHVFLERNSTQIARGSAECEGATSIVLSASTVYPLVATDVLKLRSRSTGSGMVGHNGTVVSFTCTRIGDDWGA